MLESTLSTVRDGKIDKELISKAMSKIIEFGFEGTVEAIAWGKGFANSSLRVKLKEQFFDEMFPPTGVYDLEQIAGAHLEDRTALPSGSHGGAGARVHPGREGGERGERCR